MSNVSITKSNIASALNEYSFRNIWNEVHKEGRNNILTSPINRGHAFTGYYYLGNDGYELPYGNQYHVYMFSKTDVYEWHRLPNNTWISSVDLCNMYGLLVHAYGIEGKVLPKGSVYVRLNEDGIIHMIIDKRALKQLDMINSDIFITTQYDTTEEDPITIYSNFGISEDITYYINNTNPIYQYIAFINGYNYDASMVSSISNDTDMIDIIIDKNIIGSFNIDITNTPRVYYSSRDMLFKQIIHIPKELNPNNKVITYDTLGLYIRDMDTHKGAYLQYTSDSSMYQITHNDCAISVYILDSYKDYIQTTRPYIEVKIRTYNKNNRLIEDSNYINLLYKTQTDEQILDHLQGKLDNELYFWKASELEKSNYTQMFLDTPNIITEDSLNYFIDALGYFNCVSLIGKRIMSYKLTSETINNKYYIKPAIWSTEQVYPVIYKNGTKIHNDHIYFTDMDNYIYIDITNYTINIGDILTIVYFPIGNNNYYVFTPTDTQSSISIPNNYPIKLYEIINTTEYTNGMYRNNTKSYIPLNTTIGNIIISNSNGNYTINFGNNLFNKDILIIYDYFTHYTKYNLNDYYIPDTKSFVLPLEKIDTTIGNVHPVLNYNDVYVYLNNKYLIRDIDYTVTESTDQHDNVSMVDIVIQNMTYAKDDDDNLVEIIITSIDTEDIDTGYVINNRASIDPDVDLHYSGLSMTHIDGQYEYDIVSQGTYLELPEGKYHNGTPHETRTMIPKYIKDIFLPKTSDNDILKLKHITNYLTTHDIPISDIIIVPHSHRIMSSYINYIINKIMDDTIKIGYDPNTTNMLTKLTPYEHLKRYDLIYNNNQLDLRYVDISPTYIDISSIDTTKRAIIRKLVEYLLPQDIDQSGVTINE